MKLDNLGFADAAGFAELKKRQSVRMGIDPTSDGDFKRTPDEDGDFSKKSDEGLLGKPITSPPDGGSDFKKDADKSDADKDSSDKTPSEDDKDEDKASKPKDDKSKKDDSSDRQVPVSDEPIEITVLYPIPEDDDEDDGTGESGSGDTTDDTSEESLAAAAEGLFERISTFFSSSKSAPKIEKGIEGLKKYLSEIPEIVGPVDDKETSEKKATVLDYKACMGLIEDIRKATIVYAQFTKQTLGLDENRDYDIGQATSFVVRQINSINSPMLALFSAYSAQHKFHGIGEHKLKPPAESTAPLGEHGWTDTLAVKTCESLRTALSAFIGEVDKGTAQCEKRAQELAEKYKTAGSKKLDETAQGRIQNLVGTWHLMTNGMTYAETLVRRAAEAVNRTVHQLAGIYPTKGGKDDKHSTD